MPTTVPVSILRRKVVNLVRNPGFEIAPPFTAVQTAGGWIDGSSTGSSSLNVATSYGWGLAINQGSASCQYDTSTFNSGSTSMKLSTTAVSSSAFISVARFNSVSLVKTYGIPVLPNTSYKGSFWMKTNLNSGTGTAGAYVKFEEFIGAGTTTGIGNQSTKAITTTGWTNYSVTFTTGATTAFVVPQLYLDGTGGAGTLIMDAWFDDIQFAPTAGITRNTATGRLTATQGGTNMLYGNGDYALQKIVPINSAVLQVGAVTDFSCGAYVNLQPKQNVNNADDHCLFNFDLSFAANQGYGVYVGSSTGGIRMVNGNSFLTSTLGVFTYRVWHWVMFTVTGTTLKGYIDGTLVWTQTITRVATSGLGNQGMLRETNLASFASSRALYGNVRDMFSSRTLLSQSDITNIVSNSIYPPVDIHYKLNERVGPVAIDYSGNGNHGIINQPDWRRTGRTPI